MLNGVEQVIDDLIDSLVVGGPAGWWLRIVDHDDIFYKTREEAVKALMSIL